MISIRIGTASMIAIAALAGAMCVEAAGQATIVAPAGAASSKIPIALTVLQLTGTAVREQPRAKFDAFRSALDGYDRAVQNRIRLPGTESEAGVLAASRQLRSASLSFLDSVRNATDEGDRSRALKDVDEFDGAGKRMIAAADDQRGLLVDYSSRVLAMATRTRIAIDQAWMLFGRVFARDSLIALKAEIAELRTRSDRLDGARGSDLDAVLDALAATEEAIGTTLIGDQFGLTKSQGGEWFARMQEDLASLSGTRTKLQRLDVHQSVMATRFADLESQLKRPIDLVPQVVERTETVLPQEPEVQQPASAAVQEPAAAPIVPDAVLETPPIAPRPQSVADGRSHDIAWVSGAIVLLVVALVVVGTRRRWRKGSSSTSSSTTEDGTTESDSMALAFDRVAARLTHAEHALAQFEPLPDSEERALAPSHDIERIESPKRARISVLFEDVDRRVPKRAPAKNRGEGTAVTSDRHRTRPDEDLRRMLQNDELELVVQPELDPDTLEVESVVARVSWRGADGGRGASGQALEVSEESELIVPIGDWALRSAMEMVSRWHHGSGSQVRVSVDVCSAQLADPQFAERAKALLHEYQLPSRYVEICLTEAALRDVTTRDEDALRRVRALGLGVALNDFGRGYSSLAELEQMPLTRIKLDRSLANEIDPGVRLSTIASNLVDWARRVGLRLSPAEIGVPEQLAQALLEAHSCALHHFVQLGRAEERAEPIQAQHESTPSYGSFIVFRDSVVLREIEPRRGDVVVTRAATRAD